MQITINNKTLSLTRIGAGTFARVYKDDVTDRVYAFIPRVKWTNEQELSKEALSLISGQHIPAIVKHDPAYVPRIGYCDVYSMPLYHSLTGEAKKQAAELCRVYRKFVDTTQTHKLLPHWYNVALLEFLKTNGIPDSICDAIDDIMSMCAHYGQHYMLEFGIRNMKQDAVGNLILLDITFNRKYFMQLMRRKMGIAS